MRAVIYSVKCPNDKKKLNKNGYKVRNSCPIRPNPFEMIRKINSNMQKEWPFGKDGGFQGLGL